MFLRKLPWRPKPKIHEVFTWNPRIVDVYRKTSSWFRVFSLPNTNFMIFMIFISGKVGDPKHFPNKPQTFTEQNPYIAFQLKTPGFKNPYFYRTKPIKTPYETIRNLWVFWLPGLSPFIAVLLSFLGSAIENRLRNRKLERRKISDLLSCIYLKLFVNCLWYKVFQLWKHQIDRSSYIDGLCFWRLFLWRYMYIRI